MASAAGDTFQKMRVTGGFLTGISDRLSSEGSNNNNEMLVGNQHLLYGFLKQLYEKPPGEPQTTEKGIMLSIAYMEEHYDEVITREQLAQIAGISQWHYSRKFNEQYGKSPTDYLASYRIYRAQEQLLLTSARYQEIAKKPALRMPIILAAGSNILQACPREIMLQPCTNGK